MKNLLRDLFKITVFVILIYAPVFFLSVYSSFSALENNVNTTRKEHLQIVREAIQKLLQEDRVLEACQRLAAEQSAMNIQTYTLTSVEGNCEFPNGMQLPPITALGTVQEFKVAGTRLFFLRDATKDVEWAISVPRKNLNLADNLIASNSKVLIESIIQSFISIIYIVAAFSFLGVLVLAKSIQNQYRKNGKDPIWFVILSKAFGWLQLHDLKIVKSATTAMLRKNETLVKDHDLLETSLEFSILNEIRRNNQNIPYTFRGTVAKVDINGFSKAVSAGQSKESQNLTKRLEEFGCELLLRYEGLFEKTVGDEIVVVFKSEDSALLATSFARDLMREFSDIEFDFGDEKRRFTLKSSISSSEVIFSKRPPGYGFMGDCLTYATRLLDVVNIKDRNILSCLRSQAIEIGALVNLPADLRTFEFKNMSSAEGYLIDHFYRIQDIYDDQPELIKYFRSNDDILFMLEKVQTETDFEKLNFIFASFNNSSIRVTTAAVIAGWIETLKAFEKRVYQDPNLSFSFSRLIVEGARLIPIQQWNAACTEAVVSISRYIEGRINASVVDVLIEKDLNLIAIEQEKSFIIESDQSFRTRGNLLINQAIHELTNTTLEKVIKMIQSKNAMESATGVYCACRIIIYYRRENPAELETFMSYKKMSKVLNELYLNRNKDVSPRLLKLLDQVNSYNELTYREIHP
jgi:hypothetical protein